MRFILCCIISITVFNNAYSSECEDGLARAAIITNLTVISAGATVVTKHYWENIRSGYESVRNFIRSQLPWGSPFHEMAYKIVGNPELRRALLKGEEKEHDGIISVVLQPEKLDKRSPFIVSSVTALWGPERTEVDAVDDPANAVETALPGRSAMTFPGMDPANTSVPALWNTLENTIATADILPHTRYLYEAILRVNRQYTRPTSTGDYIRFPQFEGTYDPLGKLSKLKVISYHDGQLRVVVEAKILIPIHDVNKHGMAFTAQHHQPTAPPQVPGDITTAYFPGFAYPQ